MCYDGNHVRCRDPRARTGTEIRLTIFWHGSPEAQWESPVQNQKKGDEPLACNPALYFRRAQVNVEHCRRPAEPISIMLLARLLISRLRYPSLGSA